MLVPTALFNMPPQTPICLYERGVLHFAARPFASCGAEQVYATVSFAALLVTLPLLFETMQR